MRVRNALEGGCLRSSRKWNLLAHLRLDLEVQGIVLLPAVYCCTYTCILEAQIVQSRTHLEDWRLWQSTMCINNVSEYAGLTMHHSSARTEALD